MESIGAPRRRRRIRKGDVDSIVLAWYGWLSGLTQGTVLTLQAWADHLQLPLVTVVLYHLATDPDSIPKLKANLRRLLAEKKES